MNGIVSNIKDEIKSENKNFPLCDQVDVAAKDNLPQKVYDLVEELAAFFYEIDNKSEESKP